MKKTRQTLKRISFPSIDLPWCMTRGPKVPRVPVRTYSSVLGIERVDQGPFTESSGEKQKKKRYAE